MVGLIGYCIVADEIVASLRQKDRVSIYKYNIFVHTYDRDFFGAV